MRTLSGMALRLSLALLVGILAVGPLWASEPPTDSLRWITNKTEAYAAARTQGKLVLLLVGRATCSNCKTMKEVVAESTYPPVKTLINDYFIPWYSDIDSSEDYRDYSTNLNPGWILPLICVIDPAQSSLYLDRSTGIQQPLVFHQRLLRHATPLMTQPRITGFEPVQGSAGTHVRIEGSNLTNVIQVLFNGVEASFTISDSRTLEAEVPMGAGSGPITVITACGQATSPGEFAVIEGGVVMVHQGILAITNQSFLAVFHLTVSNQGPNIALNLDITNALALGANLNPTNWPATNLAALLPYEAESSQGSPYVENGAIRWPLGNLAPAAQASLTLKFFQAPAGRLNALATCAVSNGPATVTLRSALSFVDIPAIPTLGIQRTNTVGLFTVSWSGEDPRWILQSTPALSLPGPPVWANVSIPSEGSTIFEVAMTNALDFQSQFYRLVFDPTKAPPTNTVCPCSCDP